MDGIKLQCFACRLVVHGGYLQKARVDPVMMTLIAAGLLGENHQVVPFLQVPDALPHGGHHPHIMIHRHRWGKAKNRRQEGSGDIRQSGIVQGLQLAARLPPVILPHIGRYFLGMQHRRIHPNEVLIPQGELDTHINGAESTCMVADEHAGFTIEGFLPNGLHPWRNPSNHR